MSLQSKIEDLKNIKNDLLIKIEEVENHISSYEKLEEIPTHLLIKEIEGIKELKTTNTKGFKVNVYNGNYEHILGGDGRSRPWSEERKGVICDVQSNYYLTEIQEKLISEYIKHLGKIDRLKFITPN